MEGVGGDRNHVRIPGVNFNLEISTPYHSDLRKFNPLFTPPLPLKNSNILLFSSQINFITVDLPLIFQ